MTRNYPQQARASSRVASAVGTVDSPTAEVAERESDEGQQNKAGQAHTAFLRKDHWSERQNIYRIPTKPRTDVASNR
ncbi:MAG: hypothetical protein QG615_1152, partial [Nitrospirota bacterium]|nr:hypothetical protein [Nitrospirota bacterium]